VPFSRRGVNGTPKRQIATTRRIRADGPQFVDNHVSEPSMIAITEATRRVLHGTRRSTQQTLIEGRNRGAVARC